MTLRQSNLGHLFIGYDLGKSVHVLSHIIGTTDIRSVVLRVCQTANELASGAQEQIGLKPYGSSNRRNLKC